MIRSLAAWLLNSFVGQYVENLTPDQLRLGILEGCFEVQNLPLKRDAFRSSWPLAATAGSIGRITLRTPSVHNLLREAWLVSFEDIEVCFKVKQDEDDSEEDESKKQERKLRKLANQEETWRNELLRNMNTKRSKQLRNSQEIAAAAAQQGAFYTSWFYSAATAVLKNVRITVERVHVRIVHELFASPLSDTMSYVIGVRIGSIRVDNDIAEDDSSRRRIIKVLRIDDINVYCTSSSTSAAEIAQQLRVALPADADCLVSHLHVDASLDIDTGGAPKSTLDAAKSAGSSASVHDAATPTPKLMAMSSSVSTTSLSSVVAAGSHLHISVSTQRNAPFTVRVRSSQLRLIDAMCQELTYLDRRRRYAAIRKRFFDTQQCGTVIQTVENLRHKEHAGRQSTRLWHFAIACATHDVGTARERLSWTFVLERAQMGVRYVRLCELDTPPTDEERRLRNDIESRLTFDELSVLRRVAFRRSHQRRSAALLGAPLRGGGSLFRDWLQFHTRWWNAPVAANGVAEAASLSDEERRLVSEFNDETEAAGRANWQTRIALGCERFELQLVDGHQGELLFSSAVSSFNCELESNSLASRSRRFAVTIGSVAVFDHHRNIELCQQSAAGRTSPLLDASYEERRVLDRAARRRRADATTARAIRVRVAPLSVLLNGAIVDELLRFVTCEWRAAFGERLRDSLQRYVVEQFEKGTLLLDADIAALEKSLRLFRSNAELNRRSRTRRKLDYLLLDVIVESPRVVLCAHAIAPTQPVPESAAVCCELDCFSVQSRAADQPTPFSSNFDVAPVYNETQLDDDEDEDDDEFATPCATPELEEDATKNSLPGNLHVPLSGNGGGDVQHLYVTAELNSLSVFVDDLAVINSQLRRAPSGRLRLSQLASASTKLLLNDFSFQLQLNENDQRSFCEGDTDQSKSDACEAEWLVSGRSDALALTLSPEKLLALLACVDYYLPLVRTVYFVQDVLNALPRDSQADGHDREQEDGTLTVRLQYRITHVSVSLQRDDAPIFELRVAEPCVTLSLDSRATLQCVAICSSIALVDCLQPFGNDHALLLHCADPDSDAKRNVSMTPAVRLELRTDVTRMQHSVSASVTRAGCCVNVHSCAELLVAFYPVALAAIRCGERLRLMQSHRVKARVSRGSAALTLQLQLGALSARLANCLASSYQCVAQLDAYDCNWQLQAALEWCKRSPSFPTANELEDELFNVPRVQASFNLPLVELTVAGRCYPLATLRLNTLSGTLQNDQLQPARLCYEGSVDSVLLLDRSPYATVYEQRFVCGGRQKAVACSLLVDLKDWLVQYTVEFNSPQYVHTLRLTEELYRQYKLVAAMGEMTQSILQPVLPAADTSKSLAVMPKVNITLRLCKPSVVLPECYCSHRAMLIQASEIALTRPTDSTFECSIRRLALDLGTFNQTPTRVTAPFDQHFAARAPQPLYKTYDLRAQVTMRPPGAALSVPLLRLDCNAEPLEFFLNHEHYAQLKSTIAANFGEDIEEEALVAYSKSVAEQFAAAASSASDSDATLCESTECESLFKLYITFPQISFSVLEQRANEPEFFQLARICFNKAHLLMELYSNSLKVIDLVASSVHASSGDLQLVTRSGAADSTSTPTHTPTPDSLGVQLEFHWRISKRKFVWSAVLDALALLVHVDTWLKLEQLLFGEIDNPLLSSHFVQHRVAVTKLTSVRSSIPLDDREMTLKLNFCNIELLLPVASALTSTQAHANANANANANDVDADVFSLRTTCTLIIKPLSQAPISRRIPSGESSVDADAALCTEGETVSESAFRRSFTLQFLVLQLRSSRLRDDGRPDRPSCAPLLEAARLNVENQDTLRETCADNRQRVREREGEGERELELEQVVSVQNGDMVSTSTSMATIAPLGEQHRSVAAFQLLLVQTSSFELALGPVTLAASLAQLDTLRSTLDFYMAKIAAHLERRDREKVTQAQRSNQDAISIRRRKLQLGAKCDRMDATLQVGNAARLHCVVPFATARWTRLSDASDADEDDAWLRLALQLDCAVLRTEQLEPVVERASLLFTFRRMQTDDDQVDIRQLQAAHRSDKERTIVSLGLEFDDRLDVNVSHTVLDAMDAVAQALGTPTRTEEPPECGDAAKKVEHARHKETTQTLYIVENALGVDAFCCVTRSVTRTDESGVTRVELAGVGDSEQCWKLLPASAQTPLSDAVFAAASLTSDDDPLAQRRQILVRVDGYAALTSAILLDQVGTHVRYARPRDERLLPYPIRILIDISLDTTRCCKLIRLRSALSIKNQLDWPLQVRLDSLLKDDDACELTLDCGATLDVNLRWLYSSIHVRPLLVLDSAIRSRVATDEFSFTVEPVQWIVCAEACTEQQQAQLVNCVCHAKLPSRPRSHVGAHVSVPSLTAANFSDEPGMTRSYYFAALVERMRYADVDYQVEQSRTGFGFPISLEAPDGNKQQYTLPYPNHTVTFLPAVSVVNLLPTELRFYATPTVSQPQASEQQQHTMLDVTVKPSSERPLYEIDFAAGGMVFGVRLDRFVRCAELALNCASVSHGVMYDLWMYDERDRALQLFALIETLDGARAYGDTERDATTQARPIAALRLYIGAHYLLVNEIGIPLVFRQHEVKPLAAGQSDEHELACNREPFLFSFADSQVAAYCSARIGRGTLGECDPRWCERFSLDEGFRVRYLYVSEKCPGEIRPDRVYAAGIECKRGRGPLAHTTTVTFLPRYRLENRSSRTLQLAQTCHVKPIVKANAHVETLLPGATRPFHFPRFDLDQLISVRLVLSYERSTESEDAEDTLQNSSFSEEALEIYRQRHAPDCRFSAGFRIDQLKCFHILMRAAGRTDMAYFVHAQIVNQGASLCVRFLDADHIPPPFRVENVSRVAVKFYQHTQHDAEHEDEDESASAAQSAEQLDAEQHCYVMRPGSHMTYALDDLLGQPVLNVAVLSDPSAHSCGLCDLRASGTLASLKYENFAYICLAATHSAASPGRRPRRFSLEQVGEMVLDVSRDGHVFLGRKERGKRSQLWRISAHGYIEHIGSSYHSAAVPFADDSLPENAADFVLDVDELALQPAQAKFVTLVVRRRDERRRLTQLWRFTNDGRIITVYGRLCAQLKGGSSAIYHGAPLVVGPAAAPHSASSSPAAALPHSAAHTFLCQQVQPGSGLLHVRVSQHGPTRVLRIVDAESDLNEPLRATMPRFVPADTDDFWSWHTSTACTRARATSIEACTQTDDVSLLALLCDESASSLTPARSLLDTIDCISTTLKVHCVAISLVSPACDELALLTVRGAEAHVAVDARSRQRSISLSITDLQLDNETLDAQVPVILFVAPNRRSQPTNDDDDDAGDEQMVSAPSPVTPMPAVSLRACYTKDVPRDVTCESATRVTVRRFDECVLETKKMVIQIDEKWLWRIIQFALTRSSRHSKTTTDADADADTESDADQAKMKNANEKRQTLSPLASRYLAFANLNISTPKLILGVTTCSSLPRELAQLKRSLRIPLIAFEHARVEIAPFSRSDVLEPASFLLDALQTHYMNELRKQAAKILGSVDFLGNPLGLLNDVSEGLADLVTDGNVANLVMNVTHGLSNTAAKVASSLSNSLVLDTDFKRVRERIKMQHAQPGGGQHSADHLVAGLKSLAYGVKGGLTSLITHTYKGAQDDGLNGMFRGAARGLFGTITKPVAGMLDFASGAASAVRDTSRTALTNKYSPVRARDPRALAFARFVRSVFPLARFDDAQALGQMRMYKLNSNNYAETFLAVYVLHTLDSVDMLDCTQAIVSDRRFYLFRLTPDCPEVSRDGIVSSVALDEIVAVRAAEAAGNVYVVLDVAHKHVTVPGLARPVAVAVSSPTAGPAPTGADCVTVADSDAALSPSSSANRIRCDSRAVANQLVHTISLVKLLRFNLASFIDVSSSP